MKKPFFSVLTAILTIVSVSPTMGVEKAAPLLAIPQNGDPPVAICQDLTVSANDTCMAVVSAEQLDNGSYDPDADSLIFTMSPEGPFGLGLHEVLLTVTDTTGLFDECTSFVEVVDDAAPVALTQPVSLFLDEDGMAVLNPQEMDAGSYDNCGIAALEVNPGTFSCEDMGDNTVTFLVTDLAGNVSSVTETVSVTDTLPPVLTVTSEIPILWPPNHDYEEFSLEDLVLEVSDNCPISIQNVKFDRATSDEPENSNGDGNTLDDIVISDDCATISLRKERKGNSNGRVYTLYLVAEDESGLTDTAVCIVHVPHNQGSSPLDDGVAYEVIGDCSTATGLENHAEPDDGALALKCYPNPFTHSIRIEFTLDRDDQVDVSIHDLQGNLVNQIYRGHLSPGDHAFEWSGGDGGAKGPERRIFLMRLITSEKSVVTRLIRF